MARAEAEVCPTPLSIPKFLRAPAPMLFSTLSPPLLPPITPHSHHSAATHSCCQRQPEPGVEYLTQLENGSPSSPLWEMPGAMPGLWVTFWAGTWLPVLNTNPSGPGGWEQGDRGSCTMQGILLLPQFPHVQADQPC